MPSIRQEEREYHPKPFLDDKGNSVPGHRDTGWLEQSTHPYHSNPPVPAQRGLLSKRDD
ncbi:MAG: hypothetical protein GXY48_15265 [Methanomicrobiales archaeon]|nr:hypothetical protein [Methanomicrobiales archaeon]